MTVRPSIFDLSTKALRDWVSDHGEPAYRVQQIRSGIYQRLLTSPNDMTDLSRGLRESLGESFAFGALSLQQLLTSSDGQTEKALFELPDRNPIEAVLMRYDRRRTACISTQSGCALGCVFCATGQMGLARNLTAGEIVEQVLFFARRLAASGDRLTNVVVMGMGEPFHNYGPTMKAIERLNDPQGFGFGARRFTVSTVGLVPRIEQFTREHLQVNLAVSLHAATDDLRSELLPINRKYPLDVLMRACEAYVEQTGRRITFEWALIQDKNDTEAQAHALVERIRGLNCHVNLIPLNPTPGYQGDPTQVERAESFRSILQAAAIPCTIRIRRGIDIQAGCGQLAAESSTPA